MMLYFMMSMLVSTALIYICHPVAIMAAILLQTLLICVMMWTSMKISWFSFILFLIFLGGLMVLFIYITSLASNEKFEINLTELFLTTSKLLLILVIFMAMSYFLNKENSLSMNLIAQLKIMFSESMMFPILLIMNYLLLTLIVVVKISSKYNSPIRSMIKK